MVHGVPRQTEGGIVMRDTAQHVGIGGQPFDHDNANIVGMIMHQKMRYFGH